MSSSRWGIALSLLLLTTSSLQGRKSEPTLPADRIQLKLNTEEAEAVLAILDKRATRATVSDSDWQRLFATEPYIRLKKRGVRSAVLSGHHQPNPRWRGQNRRTGFRVFRRRPGRVVHRRLQDGRDC